MVVLNHPGGQTAQGCRGLGRRTPPEAPAERPCLRGRRRRSSGGGSDDGFDRGRLRGIDTLVCNAGILRDRSIAKMPVEDWQRVIDVNLSGVFYCCKFGLEILRDGGSIVNMGSLSAAAGFHGQSNYAAAKSGVQALTRVLSRECAKRAIRVNAIAPGLIETAMSATLSEAVRAEMHSAIPWHKFGVAQDVANAVLFLCSPLAGYITGHVLEVNGGWRG